MFSFTAELAFPALAQVICLAVVIVPPFLAIITSFANTFIQCYGHTILRILTILATVSAHIAQLAMVPASLGYIYYCFQGGVFTIQVNANIPDSVAFIYTVVLLLAVALGFLGLMVAGLYLIEWAVTPVAVKGPMDLAMIEMAITWSCALFQRSSEQVTTLKSFAATTLGPAKKETVTTEKSSHRNTTDATSEDHLLDEDTASDGDLSVIGMDTLSDIEQWK